MSWWPLCFLFFISALSNAQSSTITVSPSLHTIATISPSFLSFSIDMSTIVDGNDWNQSNERINLAAPQLIYLAKQLTPAVLRIGGTRADETFYAMDNNPAPPPKNYARKLFATDWDNIHAFVNATRVDLVFGINAGLGPRDGHGAWLPTNAAQLFEYTVKNNYPVLGFEFSNEPNLYLFNWDFTVSGTQLGKDFLTFATALGTAYQSVQTPPLRIAADLAYQLPYIGDIDPFFMSEFVKVAASALDVATWHWYPWMSTRCPLYWLSYATPNKTVDPSELDLMDPWAKDFMADVANGSPSTQLWMGESATAACNGEPGTSDAFASGFWYLDELGKLAALNHQVVVRQTLWGGVYALLQGDSNNPVPAPDYWTAVLWKRLVGGSVLDVTSSDRSLRAYSFCSTSPGAIVLVLLNLRATVVTVSLTSSFSSLSRVEYQLTSSDLTSKQIFLNGNLLSLNQDGTLPTLAGNRVASGGPVLLKGQSYAFVQLLANASICA